MTDLEMANQALDSRQKTLYFGAALFCSRELNFNVHLNDKLEKLGYKTNFPQRDGFEFSPHTANILEELFESEHERSHAIGWVIYLIDVGKFLYTADVMIANLDEVTDPGVIVEMMFAHQLGKPVVGYRTEARSPFGTMTDFSKGMHFFLYFPCDYFLTMPSTNISTIEQVDRYNAILAEELDRGVKIAEEKFRANGGGHISPEGRKLVELSQRLFHGINDYQDKDQITTLFKRFKDMKPELAPFEPTCRFVPKV